MPNRSLNRFSLIALSVFLWAVSLTITVAQVQPLTINVYRPNPKQVPVNLAPSDTGQVITVKAFKSDRVTILSPALQPYVTRTGTQLRFGWVSTSLMPETSWIEVKIGQLVKLAGLMTVTKNPDATSPLSVTYISDVPGPPGPPGTTSFAGLSGIPAYLSEASLNSKVSLSQLDARLINMEPVYQVNSYAQAVALTQGRTDSFAIRVLVDETNGNSLTRYDYSPTSPMPDHLDRRISN